MGVAWKSRAISHAAQKWDTRAGCRDIHGLKWPTTNEDEDKHA
jgi:hypothetical protein